MTLFARSKNVTLSAFMIFLPLLLASQGLESSVIKRDSLNKLLSKRSLPDTTRVYILVELASTCLSDDQEDALPYISDAKELAEELGFPKGKARSQRLLGQYYNTQSDHDKAIIQYTQSIGFWTSVPNRSEVAIDLLHIGESYKDKREYPVALIYLDSARVILDSLGSVPTLARAYDLIGECHYKQRHAEDAISNYKIAVELYERTGNEAATPTPLTHIGSSNRLLGEYDSSIVYHTKVLEYGQRNNDTKRIALALYNLSGMYMTQGFYAKSLEHSQKSLASAEKIDHKLLISTSLNLIALAHRKNEEFDKELLYLKKAESVAISFDNKEYLTSIYNNIGTNYLVRPDQELDQSLIYYMKSLRLAEEREDPGRIVSSYSLLGNYYSKIKDYSSAKEYLNKSLSLAVKLKSKPHQGSALGSLARVYLEDGEFQKALKYAQQSHEIALLIPSDIGLSTITELLSQCNAAVGRYEDAYKQLVVVKNLNDSIQGEKNTRELTALEYEYKYDKEKAAAQQEQLKLDLIRDEREKRLFLLRNYLIGILMLALSLAGLIYWNFLDKKRANSILQEQKQKIEKTSAELVRSILTRDKILGMLSHDVLGMIQFTSIMAKQLPETSADSTDHKEREYHLDLLESIDNLQGVIDKTLKWAKTQREGFKTQKQSINVHDLVNQVFRLLTPRIKSRSLQYDNLLEKQDTILSDERLLFSILHNLIENELKHNQAESIYVEGQKSEEYYSIEISASGLIDDSTLNTFFQSEDNSSYSHQGLGLFIVRDFVQLLNAKVLFTVHYKKKLHTIRLELPIQQSSTVV